MKRSSGFTLFEILIAMFIFSIIVTTIFGSFTAIFSNADALQEGIDTYEMANTCLNRMITDIRESYISAADYKKPGAGADEEPDNYRVVGDVSYAGSKSFSRLRFTSRAHVSLEKSTQGGIAEIVYYVHQTKIGDEDIYLLKRADSLYPYERFKGNTFEEKGADPVLCEGVKSLEFKFYDDEGTEYDTWNSESEESKYATPRAVKIKLEIGDESSSFFFETMVNLLVFREKTE